MRVQPGSFRGEDGEVARGKRLGRLGVHAVLRADQHRVGEPAAFGQLPPVARRVPGGDAVLGAEALAGDGQAVPVFAGLPTCAERTMYPRRDMRMKVAFVYVPCRLDWRVRRGGREHWVAGLARLLGVTERG